jgi:DNA-binding MarR family transcriptional regulator
MDRQELSRLVAEYCSHRQELLSLYADYAKQHGLSYSGLYVLYHICLAGDTCTQKTICDKTFLPKQTVNVIISSFVKQKMIKLSELQDNRRAKSVKLTDSGKKFADKIIPKIVDAELNAMGRMDAEQQAAFIGATKQYKEYLRDYLQNEQA